MTRICPSGAVPEGEYRIVDIGVRSFLVARVGGRVHAVENLCGHQTRRMDGGALKTGAAGEPCIECPHHAMCFDLRDGHVVEDAGLLGMDGVRPLATKDEAGLIWIEIPAA